MCIPLLLVSTRTHSTVEGLLDMQLLNLYLTNRYARHVHISDGGELEIAECGDICRHSVGWFGIQAQ
jgi:hypothetical protein